MSRSRPPALAALAAALFAACGHGLSDSERSAADETEITGGNASASIALSSDWGGGYCATVTIANTDAVPITSWQVVVQLNQSTLANLWSGASTQSGSLLMVTPLSYDAAIPVGGSTSFGFCGNATGPNYRPSLVSVTTVPSGPGSGSTSASASSSTSASSSSSTSSSSSSSSTSSSSGGPSCPPPSGTAVSLAHSGSAYTLANGLVTVTVAASGQVTQVAKNGKNLMASGDSLYVSENGGSTYYTINATTATVVRQSSDLVELSFKDTSAGVHDMNWDLHYVVRRGVSGFYYFLVADTVGRSPATLGELRTVQRFDASILSNGYNGERRGALPTAAQNASFTTATQIQDATYPLVGTPDPLPGTPYSEGPVFSKYDWATYRTEDLVHGLYGNGFGAFLLSPSWEFYTGGPVKQELMVHHDNLVLNMYHGGHFGSAISAPSPSSWQKIYGPNLVYVNAGSDAQVIADAQAQAAAERSQWPYCWMSHGLYPTAAGRGTVSGKIVEAHGRSTAGVMVTLAQAGPLLTQGYDYLFWAQADAGGQFSIPAVRPGAYALHVYATQGTIVDDPTTGEVAANVTVVAGANNLGTVTWSPPFHQNLLWSIGTSDQTSGEFRFDPGVAAGPNNVAGHTGRTYGPSPTAGVWTVPPANVTYTIGSSAPASDWYFAQSVTGTWTVDFTLASVPPGGAFLTIGVAGAARNPHLAVAVNGHAVITHDFGNDQSLYRSALEGGFFEMLAGAVPAADLHAGANAVTFQLTNGGGGTGIYYDVIKLESD